MQNNMLARLKQSIVEKEYAHRFTQLMQPTIRLNKEEKVKDQINTNANILLPSISNTKLALTGRNKSHSAKKIPSKGVLQRSKNSKSTKKLLYEPSSQRQQTPANHRYDFDDLIIKKQNVAEGPLNKQAQVRAKFFSLRTPSREGERPKDTMQTKDITAVKDTSNVKTERATRAVTIKEFNAKMQKLSDELLLTIRGGKMDSESLDNKKIMSYMHQIKSSNSEYYRKIHRILEKILQFVEKHGIIYANIEWKMMVQLTGKKVLSNYEILSTFCNNKELASKYKIIGLEYYTNPQKKGHDLAANRIISLFKMAFAKRFYKNLSGLLKKVKIIQNHWRIALLARKSRQAVLERINARIQNQNRVQKQFCKDWNIIKTCQRFQIHICSYSLQQFKRLTTKHLRQKQNSQITRIFKAVETDVSVIYVLPFQLNSQVIKYYHSIFNFNPSNLHQKVYFIVPQNRAKIQERHCPLTTVAGLLYSPKALKRIKQIVNKQHVYIVPSFPSVEYISLAAELNVPIMGCQQNLAKLYSTKSGALKIFQKISNKEKPPFNVSKSVVSIFSEKELINSLAILIYKNPECKVWYLKIQDELHSRGIAYLNINKIVFLREICSGTSQFEHIEENQMIRLIAQELRQKLKHRLKIINKDVYPNYTQFLSHFLTRGGIIQAGIEGDKHTQFSISFLIQPSGEFQILGTYNKLELGGKSINQSIRFPSLLQNVDYEGITRNLYKELWVKLKLFGYYTADFVYSNQRIYAIGLDCFLNQKTSSLFMANFCCNTSYNKDRNELLNIKDQQVHFTYCPSLTLLQLPSIKTFFKNCKFENISFDLQKRVGTIFVMIDQIQSEQIGFLSIEESPVYLLKQMKKIVEYFCKNFRSTKSSHDELGLLKGAVTTSLKPFQKHKPTTDVNL